MNIFLVDRYFCADYNRFLLDINSKNDYFLTYKFESLYDYYVNLVVALLTNNPIVLIDSDLKDNEIYDLINLTEVNKKIPVSFIKYNSIKDVIENVLKSQSKITLFTSGTTGQPKKVIHTLATLTRSTKIDEKYRNQIWAFAYNPTHMAGLQVFLQAFFNENTLINVFNKDRNYIYEAIKKYNITHISATPTFYRLLMPINEAYYSVQRVTFGGEKSNSKLHNSILELFPKAKINNIYASTEAGSLFASKGENFKIPNQLIDRIKIQNEEILIHKSLIGFSDNLILDGEYYKTGDLIDWVDQSNHIFKFKSRKNELINVGGYKINPYEVQEVILSIEGVLECVVFSKPNSVLGNILCAEIKKDNEDLSESDIRRELLSKLQDFKIPRKIKFVNEFELTRTGKIKKL